MKKSGFWAAILLTAGLTAAAFSVHAEGADPAIEEGYTEEGEGYTSVVTWTKNGDMNIYGKFYYPEGFDESQTYPTVIMSHGLGSTATMVERAQWPQAAAREGFVVYAFDYCGGTVLCRYGQTVSLWTEPGRDGERIDSSRPRG